MTVLRCRMALRPRPGKHRFLLVYQKCTGFTPQRPPAWAYECDTLAAAMPFRHKPVEIPAVRPWGRLEAECGWLGALVARRLDDVADRYWMTAGSAFQVWMTRIDHLRRRGIEVGYVGPITVVPGLKAVLPLAFWQSAAFVGEYAHGGNYRLARRAGICNYAYGFTDALFAWGKTDTDEFRVYGLPQPQPVNYVTVGTWLRRPGIKATKDSRPAQNTRPRILYAPTIIDSMLFTGIGPNFEEYVPVLRSTLQILNEATADVVVSYLPTEGWEVATSDLKLNNIRLEPLSFSRNLDCTDYVITDSYGGSPLYETLLTDIPILFLAAPAFAEYDENFIHYLHRRARVSHTYTDYIQCVESAARDVKTAIPRPDAEAVTFLRDLLGQSMNEDTFWNEVDNTAKSFYQNTQRFTSQCQSAI